MKLLIIADDFTGALDTGVQFASRGIPTLVVTSLKIDRYLHDEKTVVLVVDAETRHKDTQAAYATVYELTRKALDAGVSFIYKKTDSALRGNIGAELSAVMDAAGETMLPFIPAFPSMNRTTENGVHYIQGVPVAESVFGKDPFEPVRHSLIADILKTQSRHAVVSHRIGDYGMQASGIHVFDAQTQEDLDKIALHLGQRALKVCAGCAGFATVLANRIQVQSGEVSDLKPTGPLLVVCGSINQVTKTQLETAEKAGFARIYLLPEEKLENKWLSSESCEKKLEQCQQQLKLRGLVMLDVNSPPEAGVTETYIASHDYSMEEVRVRIADTLGTLVKKLLDKGIDATLLCTGGDTLLSVMNCLGISQLIPLGEVNAGTVLTKIHYQGKDYQILAKSGGFGKSSLFCDLEKQLNPRVKELSKC